MTTYNVLVDETVRIPKICRVEAASEAEAILKAEAGVGVRDTNLLLTPIDRVRVATPVAVPARTPAARGATSTADHTDHPGRGDGKDEGKTRRIHPAAAAAAMGFGRG